MSCSVMRRGAPFVVGLGSIFVHIMFLYRRSRLFAAWSGFCGGIPKRRAAARGVRARGSLPSFRPERQRRPFPSSRPSASERRDLGSAYGTSAIGRRRDSLYLIEQPPVLWFRWRKRAGDRSRAVRRRAEGARRFRQVALATTVGADEDVDRPRLDRHVL